MSTSASPSQIAADEQLATPAGDAVAQGRLVPHLDDEDDHPGIEPLSSDLSHQQT